MSSDRTKTVLYGRIVFGGSAVLFGVIALMWHDSDTWQTLRKIWSVPFGTSISGCLMVAQIAGGILIAHPEAHLNWSEFSLNFLITGAAWMVAV